MYMSMIEKTNYEFYLDDGPTYTCMKNRGYSIKGACMSMFSSQRDKAPYTYI